MKLVLVLVALVAVVVARPQEQLAPGIIPIIEQHEVRDDFGQYARNYLSGDGTSVSEQGALKLNKDKTGYVLVKQGSVRYFSPDGKEIKYEYVADEDGFQPKGEHFPKAPVA